MHREREAVKALHTSTYKCVLRGEVPSWPEHDPGSCRPLEWSETEWLRRRLVQATEAEGGTARSRPLRDGLVQGSFLPARGRGLVRVAGLDPARLAIGRLLE